MPEEPSENDPLLPFLPEHLGAEILAGHSPDAFRQCEGVVLLFDLCAFTQLTSRLQQSGPRGAELLKETLTRLYTRVTSLIRDLDGSILQYAGDSVLAGFNYGEHQQQEGLSQVTECAHKILEAASADYGELTRLFGVMQGRIGVAPGRFERHILGNEKTPFLMVAWTGPAIQTAVRAIGLAIPGTARILPKQDRSRGPAIAADGDSGAHESPYGQDNDPMDAIRPTRSVTRDILRRFVPPILIPQIREGTEGFRGAFRSITCAFVQYSDDKALSDDSRNRQLQQLFEVLTREAAVYGGLLTQSDCSAGSMIFLFLFGAPVALDNKELAAARFAERLRENRAEKGLPGRCRIGITTGYGYVGEVGGRDRKAFSVIGESINHAARLMHSADPDEIYLDGQTAKRTQGQFRFGRRTVLLKGFPAPIEVFPLEGAAEQTVLHELQSSEPIVGRRRELASLRLLVRRTKQGLGSILVVSGQAGVGKSRLAAALVDLAGRQACFILAGACRQYEIATPFSALKESVLHFLGVEDPRDRTRPSTDFTSAAAALEPELAAYAPALLNLLGLATHEPTHVGTIDHRTRRERMFRLLVRLLKDRSRGTPIVLLIDDLHWADNITLEFLRHLALESQVLGFGILVLSRPGPHLDWLKGIQRVEMLHLEELPIEDARALLRARLALDEPDPDFEERILARVPANPFFLETIVADLQERGVFVPIGSRWRPASNLGDIAFPTSLQDTVLARIDRLEPDEQVVIKSASVIGRIFEFELLCEIVPEQLQRPATASSLVKLHQLDLAPIETPTPLTHIFKHVVIRDVAYDSLLYSAREYLHLRLAEVLERRHKNERADISDALAHHFRAGGNLRKHLQYAVLSGRKALERFSLKDGATHFRMALDSAEKLGRAGMMRRLREDLGAVLRQIGEYREAILLYDAALPTVRDAQHKARILTGRGHAHQELGEARQALADMEAALQLLGISVPRTRGLLFAAIAGEALIQLGHRLFRPQRGPPTGRQSRTLRRQLDVLLQIGKIYYTRDAERLGWIGFLTINHADRLADVSVLSHACANFASILVGLGLTAAGRTYIQRAFELGRRAARSELEGMAWLRAAFEPMAEWDPVRMRQCIDNALPLLRRSGEPWELQVCTALGGIAGLLAGDVRELRRQYRTLQTLAVHYESDLFAGWALSILPWTAWLCGEADYEQTRRSFARGLRFSRKSSDLLNQAAILAYHALIAAKEGRFRTAGRDAQRAVRHLDTYRVRVPHISLCYIYAAEAAHRAARESSDPMDRKRLQRTTRRALRTARASARQFPYLRPALARMQARMAFDSKRRRRARRLARTAVRFAAAGPSGWELALARAELARATHDDGLLEEARALLHSAGLIGEANALDAATS